jgi:hypothetical protein
LRNESIVELLSATTCFFDRGIRKLIQQRFACIEIRDRGIKKIETNVGR